MATECTDSQSPLTNEELLTPMHTKLPEYVVKCMLAAGFDVVEVITSMDISNEPGNSIELIENFINQYYAGNKEYTLSLSPFAFPPGHRIRICKFVSDVQKQVKASTRIEQKHGRSKVKAEQLSEKKGTDSSDSDSLNSSESITSVSSRVRRSISAWVKKQNLLDCLSNLRENVHFSVTVKNVAKSHFVSVYVQCFACKANIKLHRQPKHSTYSISNWTRHAKTCVILKASLSGKKSQQPSLLEMLSPPLSSSSSSQDSTGEAGPSSTESACTGHSQSKLDTSTMQAKDDTVFIYASSSKSASEEYAEGETRSVTALELEAIVPGHELLGHLPVSTVKQSTQATLEVQQTSTERDFQGAPLYTSEQKQVQACKRGATPSVLDYSRSGRRKRKLEEVQSDPAQTKIIDYVSIVNEIERLTIENEKLVHMLYQKESNGSPMLHSCTPILKQIVANAEKNASKLPHGRRHPEIMKKFATALFIYAGPLAYDFLQNNLSQVLPCLRTVQRIVHSEYETLSEGEFRFDDLSKHIDIYNAPRLISVGEDATRVISRVEYDSETDRCVGFVLPLNKYGLPEVDSFLAVSFDAIEKMFQDFQMARYAYVYMAKPLALGVPAFCLACFGSDNKFTTTDIMQRGSTY